MKPSFWSKRYINLEQSLRPNALPKRSSWSSVFVGLNQCFNKTTRGIHLPRWWFQIFFIFTPTWGRFPFWLIFSKWVVQPPTSYPSHFYWSHGLLKPFTPSKPGAKCHWMTSKRSSPRIRRACRPMNGKRAGLKPSPTLKSELVHCLKLRVSH